VPQLFEPLTIRGVTLRNRIMMSPMVQRSALPDGLPTEWHLVHYATRAIGGVGLIMFEATAVESRGRITTSDLGLWNDRHIKPLAQIVAMCHEHGAAVGVQLAHAGRKAWSDDRGHGPEQSVAPSAIAFDEGWLVPHALSEEEIQEVISAFRLATERARYAGFDVVELHAAHGYLINQFLSPLANCRQDSYGGSLENRLRFLRRVIEATREVWEDRPLFVRVSATDYVPGGIDLNEMVLIARALREAGVDLVDVSSGGITPLQPPSWPGYQVPFAERIRREAGIRTAAVGLITSPEMAEEIVANGRADIVALGRELLRNPYWPLQAAQALGANITWPRQYQRARRT